QQARIARDAVSSLHRRSQGGGDGILAGRVQRPRLPQRLPARLAARARISAGSLSRAGERYQRTAGCDDRVTGAARAEEVGATPLTAGGSILRDDSSIAQHLMVRFRCNGTACRHAEESLIMLKFTMLKFTQVILDVRVNAMFLLRQMRTGLAAAAIAASIFPFTASADDCQRVIDEFTQFVDSGQESEAQSVIDRIATSAECGRYQVVAQRRLAALRLDSAHSLMARGRPVGDYERLLVAADAPEV